MALLLGEATPRSDDPLDATAALTEAFDFTDRDAFPRGSMQVLDEQARVLKILDGSGSGSAAIGDDGPREALDGEGLGEGVIQLFPFLKYVSSTRVFL